MLVNKLSVNKFYENALNKCKEKSKEEKYIMTGLTSNVDYITHINGEEKIFNSFLSCDSINIPNEIKSKEDFINILIHYIKIGKGGEVLVRNSEVCEWIKNMFNGIPKIGGTGAQVANALSMLGYKVILHSNNMPAEQANLLMPYNIYVPIGERLIEANEAIDNSQPLEHFIFEYSKGLCIKTNSEIIKCPANNRLIVHVAEEFNYNMEFFKYALENFKKIKTILISGFNVITDKVELIEKMNFINEYINKLKNLNQQIFIYFENADTKVEDFKKLIFLQSIKFADSIGMNENEFEDILSSLGHTVDINNIEDVINRAFILYQKLSLKEIIIHTSNFSVGLTKNDPENLRDALCMGNLVACNRAITGDFGNYSQMIKCVKDIPINKKGLKEVNKLVNQKIISDNLIGRLKEDINVAVSISKEILRPVCTVGLGDSFTAGFLTLK